MRKALDTEFWEIVRGFDVPDWFGGSGDVSRDDSLESAIDNYFRADRLVRRAVLGIDIYRYSQFESSRQRVIPFIFQFLYDIALTLTKGKEWYLFQSEPLRESFIPTGDGGFQIVGTPLHAVVFATYFQLCLAAFNAHWHFPKLREFVGPLTLRYALTYDDIANVDSNFYGAAVINNSRILARDTLNRFLLDANSVEWFLRRLGNVETLLVAENKEISSFPEFSGFDTRHLDESMLFPKRTIGTPSPFRTVNLQKIGRIESKGTGLDVYNLYLQATLFRFASSDATPAPFVVTLGNLNTSGVSS